MPVKLGVPVKYSSWARTLFAGAERLFGVRLDVKGLDLLGTGPILPFMRHASVGDTVLSAVLVSSRQGIRLRHVMKRELLWDPSLDIVGKRLPDYFVRRGSGGSVREITAVRRLADDVGPDEGIFIDPEGTRSSPERQRRLPRRRRMRHRLAEYFLRRQEFIPPPRDDVLDFSWDAANDDRKFRVADRDRPRRFD